MVGAAVTVAYALATAFDRSAAAAAMPDVTAQFAQQPDQTLTPDGHFFRLPAFTLGKDVELAAVLIKFHLHRVADFLPRQIQLDAILLT